MVGQTVEFWQAVSAISAVTLIGITAIYAYLTFRLVRNAERNSWEMSRARLNVRLTTNQGGQLMLLQFENIGNSSAKAVKVSLDKPLHTTFSRQSNLQEAPLVKNGLPDFPPRTVMQYSFGVAHQWLGDEVDRAKHPEQFQITLDYETNGRRISDSVTINVVDQLNESAIQRDYLDDFGRKFPEEFRRQMDRVSRHLADLNSNPPEPMISRKSWSDWFHKMRSEARWRDRW